MLWAIFEIGVSMASPQVAQTFRVRPWSQWHLKYKRGWMCGFMPGMSPTWEEYGHFITHTKVCWPQSSRVLVDLLYRYVDSLFIALDANFCLRCHTVSNNKSDPSLSQGWGYFVEDATFKKYLSDHKNDTQEVCSCTLNLLAHSHLSPEKCMLES